MTDRPLPLLPHETIRYCLMVGADPVPAETIARDPHGSGAVIAAHRAAELSRDRGLVRLYRGEEFLAAYLDGVWVDPALDDRSASNGNGAGHLRGAT